MDSDKQARQESKGWKFGTAKQFIDHDGIHNECEHEIARLKEELDEARQRAEKAESRVNELETRKRTPLTATPETTTTPTNKKRSTC